MATAFFRRGRVRSNKDWPAQRHGFSAFPVASCECAPAFDHKACSWGGERLCRVRKSAAESCLTMSPNDYSRRTKSQVLWYGAGILVILLLLAVALPRL